MTDMFANVPGYNPKGAKTELEPKTNLDQQSGLDYEILYPGSHAALKVHLKSGESIKAESGAMIAMSATIDVASKLEGGLLGGLGRMLSEEKFFFQTLVARRGAGQILLAPTSLGSIQAISLEGRTSYNVQKDGFFAGTEGLEINTVMQNLAKGLFSGEGFFILKVHGKGTLFVSSFGMIHLLELRTGEEIIVDNQHLVAWSDTMNYHIEKAARGWLSSLTSGEELVCRFQGPGKLYIQTRNFAAFSASIR